MQSSGASGAYSAVPFPADTGPNVATCEAVRDRSCCYFWVRLRSVTTAMMSDEAVRSRLSSIGFDPAPLPLMTPAQMALHRRGARALGTRYPLHGRPIGLNGGGAERRRTAAPIAPRQPGTTMHGRASVCAPDAAMAALSLLQPSFYRSQLPGSGCSYIVEPTAVQVDLLKQVAIPL